MLRVWAVLAILHSDLIKQTFSPNIMVTKHSHYMVMHKKATVANT